MGELARPPMNGSTARAGATVWTAIGGLALLPAAMNPFVLPLVVLGELVIWTSLSRLRQHGDGALQPLGVSMLPSGGAFVFSLATQDALLMSASFLSFASLIAAWRAAGRALVREQARTRVTLQQSVASHRDLLLRRSDRLRDQGPADEPDDDGGTRWSYFADSD